jgi:phage terminase large subunit-like protein
MPEDERKTYLESLTPEVRAKLTWHWPFWARPNQVAPEGDWITWLVLAGRGFGKTRCGAEWVIQKAKDNPKCRIALVGETAADCRKVMVDGESGILSRSPPDFMPTYHPTNRQIIWPNGSIAETYNATEPDQLRGPQHHFAWCDEIAKWKYMQATWDQVQMGLRLGDKPQQVVTTTPRPLSLLKKLLVDPDTIVTKGSTYDNANNLAGPFLKKIREDYEGTRLGRQELEAEMLDDIPGALWQRSNIDTNRESEVPDDLERVIVAVDPAAGSEDWNDETGIVVVGLARNSEGYAKAYVLEDGSLRGTPEEWANKAISLYRKWEADKIVAEKNQGGEMVASVLRSVDRSITPKLVHASRGKYIRAEPISSLYEQNRVAHVGLFDKLEDQMCCFSVDSVRGNGNKSPDRVDALVWGLTELFDKITGKKRRSLRGANENENNHTVIDNTQKNQYASKGTWMGL